MEVHFVKGEENNFVFKRDRLFQNGKEEKYRTKSDWGKKIKIYTRFVKEESWEKNFMCR